MFQKTSPESLGPLKANGRERQVLFVNYNIRLLLYLYNTSHVTDRTLKDEKLDALCIKGPCCNKRVL